MSLRGDNEPSQLAARIGHPIAPKMNRATFNSPEAILPLEASIAA